jgi:putative phosphoesterase
MRIGVLSDTHLPSAIAEVGELGGLTMEIFAGVDLIMHSGDVNLPSVLDWCEQFAPVICSAGGHDHFLDDRCAPVQYVEHAGWRVGMVHDIEAIPGHINTTRQLAAEVYGDAGLDIMISGDSHFERLVYRDDVLLLDSGSPTFPHHKRTRLGSVALLELTADFVRAEIVPLGETPGSPNPTTPASITFDRERVLAASVGGEPVERMAFRPSMAPRLRV